MTITKTLFAFAGLLLITSAMTAQVENRTASIQDLHVVTGTDFLIEDTNGLAIASDEFLEATQVPERVARLIREARIDNTGLAQQSVEIEVETIDVSQEEVALIEEENSDTVVQYVTPSAGM